MYTIPSKISALLTQVATTDRSWDDAVATLATLLPEEKIWRLFDFATAGLGIALCMHRISRRLRDVLTMPEAELDAFLDRAQGARTGKLTVTFDDGYDDACYYTETRAQRFPDVEWILFVCPAKAEQQAGFRWDLARDEEPTDTERENAAPELHHVARLCDCHVATVGTITRLGRLPNVTIGNHTNCHFRPNRIGLLEFEEEIERSTRDFARLFGPQRHFAFPFGKPVEDFDERHVARVRRHGADVIWTTGRRPYLLPQRKPGAVLPRFPVHGSWTANGLAFWLAALALRARAGALAPAYAQERTTVAPLHVNGKSTRSIVVTDPDGPLGNATA